jgi:hypothetical protein
MTASGTERSTPSGSAPRDAPERWYEFEQVEVMVRPIWIKASSLEEARSIKRSDPVGSEGVPDIAPDGPSNIYVRGRGRLAEDQEIADYRAQELGLA